MNKKLKEALRNQRLKNHLKHSKVLFQKKSLLNEENLYKTFVEPFSDVFDALKIFSKDVLSNAMMVLGQVLTLSPEKQKERMKKYEERQRKIEEEWKPLMADMEKYLGTGDADIVALAFAPGFYVASSLGASAYQTAEGVGKYLDDLGLKKGFLSLLPGVSSVDTKDESNSTDDKDEKSLLDKLNTLFLGTALATGTAAAIGNQISRKNEGRRFLSESKDSFVDDMKVFMKDTGVSEEFESMQKKIFSFYESYIEEVNSDYEKRKDFVDALMKSSTVDDLLSVLESTKDPDLKEESDKIKDFYEKSREKLLNSDEFVKSVSDKISKEAVSESKDLPTVSKKTLEDAANKALFSDYMTNLGDSSRKSLEKVSEQIARELKDFLPSEKTLNILKSTKEGLSFFNMIRDAKSKYNIS